jgi:transposase
MAWTDAARRQYARPAERYAADLTDAEWALLAPHPPAPNRLGRPRAVDLREVLNALLSLLRTGCPWRLLPKEFPPRSTAFDYFRRLWEDGTWPALHAMLVMAAREQAGKGASPTAGIIDSQRASARRKPAVPRATTPARRSTGASGTSWSTRPACCWCSSSTPPTSRIAMGWRWSAVVSAGASRGCG